MRAEDRAEVERLIAERKEARRKFEEAFASRNIELAEMYYKLCSLIFMEIMTYTMDTRQLAEILNEVKR